ncbi:hypothetical protein BJ508DRAFT_411181 [Ascobolus immersus RN42]|uniref:ACB domain-containing protein n=1 Tax=Ascobolus immersus RN42 TaxID=1160509 RepID=A0A3N4IM47_ASCIM|nr:hypothetical protein BJ508DRAFT_411181 [Ascobolus immersus RN42]
MRFSATLTAAALLLLTSLATASPDHIPGVPVHQASENRIPGSNRNIDATFRGSIHKLTTAYKEHNATLSHRNATELYGLKQQAIHGAPRIEFEQRKLARWGQLKGVSKGDARARFAEAVRIVQTRIEEDRWREQRKNWEKEDERRRREEEKRRQMTGWWRDQVAGRTGQGDVKTAYMLNQMLDHSFV